MRTDGKGEPRHTDRDGNTYWLDEDSERWYDLPEDWGLDKDPSDMNEKELAATVQRDLFGCKPKWSCYYRDWCCTCKGGDHMLDQQCSQIADPNLRAVALKMKELGLKVPPATASLDKICRMALEGLRK